MAVGENIHEHRRNGWNFSQLLGDNNCSQSKLVHKFILLDSDLGIDFLSVPRLAIDGQS